MHSELKFVRIAEKVSLEVGEAVSHLGFFREEPLGRVLAGANSLMRDCLRPIQGVAKMAVWLSYCE